MDSSVGHVFMAFVDHDVVAQTGTAHLLACNGIAEGIHQHVILLGNHHKAHAFRPVAHTNIAEVLAHKVAGLLFLLLLLSLVGHLGHLHHRLHALGLDDIGIELSHASEHGHRHCCQQKHSFHHDVVFAIDQI